MQKNTVRLGRIAVLGLSLIAAGVAVAQEAADGSDPQKLSWTQPSSREALGEKGSAFLSGGAGSFVSREAMRANGVDARSRGSDAKADAQPDLSTQFNYVFGGIPSPEVTLADGQKLFSACEPHNCLGRRAFLVTDDAGQTVQSAGFLSVECAVGDYFLKHGKTPPASCDTVPTLTIYYPDRGTRKPTLSLEIVKWARSQVAANKQSDRIKIREQFVH